MLGNFDKKPSHSNYFNFKIFSEGKIFLAKHLYFLKVP